MGISPESRTHGMTSEYSERRQLDPLTGFALRDTFLDALDAVIADSSAQALRHLWVVAVAIPRLPFVNAGLGHEAGNDLIRGLADIAREELPQAFATARLEGAALAMASFGPPRRLTERDESSGIHFIGVEIESDGGRLFTNVRVGLCKHTAGDDARSMLRKAQLALAVARESASSDRQVYHPQLDVLARERTHVAKELLGAIEHDRLQLHFQPKVSLATGTMVGVEALVRWPTPGGGEMSPATFVPAAEASGLVVPLGNWVLRAACRQAVHWRARGIPPLHVAINVAPMQFQKTDIVTRIRDLLDVHDLEPSWLELELTEGALMTEADVAITRLRQLRDLGVELAIDDFGTGYSSLSYLKRFPVHRLKIDQSFVHRAHESEEDRAIVRSVVALGHNLGLRVLAEGVESEAHVQFLRAQHCDEGQGYYYSKPLTPDALAAYATRRLP